MKKFIFLVSILALFAFTLHKFHMSNTKIIYKKEDKAIQITMRCFVDDIEKTIDESDKVMLELGNVRELKKADELLERYLLANFSISINSKEQPLNYLGHEVEKDIIFFYLEIKEVTLASSFKIENKVLLNTFDDQQNVVHLEINNIKKTMVLKKDNYIVNYQY